MFQLITLEKIGFVARITLTRPERTNAMNAAMLTEIAQAMDAIEQDDEVRAVIVRGAGHAFSSGFDLKEQMDRRPTGIEAWRPILRKDFDAPMRFERFKLPDAIHFCDAIPVGNTGKASRAAVRQFIVAETRKTIRR
jgi:enoyl-CoA hydratase